MRQELFTAKLEVMEHLREQSPDAAGRVRLRRDERRAALREDRFDVLGRQVCLVRAHLADLEALCRRLRQPRELRAVGRVFFENYRRRHDVRFRPARDMGLNLHRSRSSQESRAVPG